MKVTITGAAGRIAYSLIPLLLRGHVFGHDTSIDLVLLDIPDAFQKLKGIELELEDSSFLLLRSLKVTADAEEAFVGCEVAILLGGFPRLPGMERRDLLKKNAENIKAQADALNRTANRNVKVVVVANPANTNCLVAIKTATNIPPANFTCLTRLDEERLRGMCAKKIADATHVMVRGDEVENVFIFGNHSNTQVAYIGDGSYKPSSSATVDAAALSTFISEETFTSQILPRVQNRGAEIIKCLQVSSALSAAEATAKHVRDWVGTGHPQNPNQSFSMGVYLEDSVYGVSPGIVYSVPCLRAGDTACGYTVRGNLNIPESTLALMHRSEAELLEERNEVVEFL